MRFVNSVKREIAAEKRREEIRNVGLVKHMRGWFKSFVEMERRGQKKTGDSWAAFFAASLFGIPFITVPMFCGIADDGLWIAVGVIAAVACIVALT